MSGRTSGYEIIIKLLAVGMESVLGERSPLTAISGAARAGPNCLCYYCMYVGKGKQLNYTHTHTTLVAQ